MLFVRPGSSTANAVILREAEKAGSPMLALTRIWRGRVIVPEHFDDADTSESLNLAALFADTNPIPPDILIGEMHISLEEVVAGGAIASAAVIIGENDVINDADGYLETTNVFTGATLGWKDTPSAALRASRYRAAFTPLMQLDVTVGTIAEATTGIIDVCFRYSLQPSRRTV